MHFFQKWGKISPKSGLQILHCRYIGSIQIKFQIDCLKNIEDPKKHYFEIFAIWLLKRGQNGHKEAQNLVIIINKENILCPMSSKKEYQEEVLDSMLLCSGL